MDKRYVLPFLLILVCGVCSCKKISSKKDLELISTLELEVDSIRHLGAKDMAKGKERLMALGEAYQAFADLYPEAPETPGFLFKAGELYSNDLQDYPKAIELFKRDFEKYPSHETAANSLFFVAYHYNNSLQDLENAERYYKEFLEQYPDHKMAASARFELNSLGMTAEQLIEQLTGSDSSSAAIK